MGNNKEKKELREIDRQTVRQTDRERQYRQTARERERHTYRQTERDRERQYRQTERDLERLRERERERERERGERARERLDKKRLVFKVLAPVIPNVFRNLTFNSDWKKSAFKDERRIWLEWFQTFHIFQLS